MSKLFASVCLLTGIVALGSSALSDAPQWRLNKNSVYVGGSIQVVISGPRQHESRCTLKVGSRDAEPLFGSLGPDKRWRNETAILLSHDIKYAELVGGTKADAERLWIPPVFREPGVVPITMYCEGRAIRTEKVEVIALTEEMQGAFDLLFPVVSRSAPVEERERATRWIMLIIDRMYGMTPPATPEQLQLLENDLAIIKKHPDWAEIAEMLVARLEARSHSRALVERKDGEVAGLKESIDELPSWPEIVTRCLEVTPQSPFTRAIQEDSWSTVKDIRILDAQRRGQDIFPIIKSTAPPPSKKKRRDD